MYKIKFITVIIFVFLTPYLFSQVTIGSNELSTEGVLLDLKEYNDSQAKGGGRTATKGLGLPRVALIDANKLIMSGNEIGANDDGIDQYNAHTGLLVYNTNHFCQGDTKLFSPGLYVWDGGEWAPISQGDLNAGNSFIWVTTDQENRQFRAARFGPAGIWMVDNLAVKAYDTESGVAGNYLPALPSGVADYHNPKWGYPAPNPNPNPPGNIDGTDPYYYENFREYGLLYNWLAATGGKNSLYGSAGENQNFHQGRIQGDTPGKYEVETVEVKGYVQGICPNGWHLPSDREWSLLEREIFTNPEKYSYISKEERDTWIPQTWQPAWDDFQGEQVYYSWRAGNSNPENSFSSNLAMAMKRPCMLENQSTEEINVFNRGKSFFPENGGFNAIPAGSMATSKTRHYGNAALFWASSFGGRNPTHAPFSFGITRVFSFSPTLIPVLGDVTGMVANSRLNIGDLTSVRCVYHGNNAPI